MNTPKIRFKGFKDDWEQRKVLDLLVQPVTDGPHETPRLVENGIPFISVDAIVDNKIDFSRKRGDVSEEYDAECCKKYKPQYHDVYVVKSGSTVGKVAIVETTDRFNIWSPLAALRCEGKTKPYYLFYLLQTRRMQAQILDKASNGTQPNLSMRELEKFDVLVTDNAEEQQRIGDYFKSLDHLITLHQRKCDETKQLKKFMLQKMFPKNGEKNPEIRFEGFTDAWEQRKFGDIASSFEYGLNVAAKEYDGENKYIRITDIDDNTHEFLTDCLTSPDIDLTGADNYKLIEGDILFARTGASVGKSYIYRNSDGLVYYAGFLIRARIKEECDAEFVFQNTLTDRYNKYIAVTSQRSGQPGVNAQEYAEFEIKVPKKEEQTKIGTYFRNLDHLITLHQRKCEKLKALKKFMLQNMFI